MGKYMIPSWYYQQFDADYSLDVPAEGYAGWKKQLLPINPEKTAIIVMHAWDCGTYEQYPGWYRAVEYIPRGKEIMDKVFPILLNSARSKNMKIFHITNDFEKSKNYPGYKLASEIYIKYELKTEHTNLPSPHSDKTLTFLKNYKSENSFVGKHNEADVKIGKSSMDFPENAMPSDNEPIVSGSEQLHAVCLEYGINHLVYIGFAINWCLQHADGNMNDMHLRGFLCSAIREAVTAVENKQSARTESNKEHGLWVTGLQNGFVYNLEDFTKLLDSL